MKKDQFKLENQYQLYLKGVGLQEHKLSGMQKKETKRAFFGACGQMLRLLRDDISELSNEKAIEVLQNMLEQVIDFWVEEVEVAKQ